MDSVLIYNKHAHFYQRITTCPPKLFITQDLRCLKAVNLHDKEKQQMNSHTHTHARNACVNISSFSRTDLTLTLDPYTLPFL